MPRSSFWPQPEVDSTILRIVPLIDANKKLTNADLFFRIVKSGFSSPRKQLINNLSNGLGISREQAEKWLLGAGIAPERRAETLAVEEWLHLTKLSP